jgi:hypothetical protein
MESKMKPNKIFIQIASYRDPQLLPTLHDCIEKAHDPDNLVFCLAWQHCKEDAWDNVEEYENDPRFKIIDIDYRVTKGVCWARNLIQKYYDDEEFTLQLDSHHRFIQNWDTELIAMYRQLKDKGHEKPVLTAYLPSFNPDKDPEERVMKPWKLNLDRFIPEGVIFFMPATIDDFESRNEPIPCRFYSAHFCFTTGLMCREVPHDPNYYFHGEEISIAVRLFTWGYSLFSPQKVIAWHEYTRRYRTKHWDDHNTWNERNRNAHIRFRKLVGVDGYVNDIDFGQFGLGNVKTVEDYERYAGIYFKTRGIQQYTLDNKLPPNPVIEDQNEYLKSFINVFKHCIDIHESQLPHNDYKFIAVIFEDKEGKNLHRQDIVGDEIKKLKDEHDKFYKIWRTFNYEGEKPYKYVVWPFSEKHEWCNRIDQIIYKY